MPKRPSTPRHDQSGEHKASVNPWSKIALFSFIDIIAVVVVFLVYLSMFAQPIAQTLQESHDAMARESQQIESLDGEELGEYLGNSTMPGTASRVAGLLVRFFLVAVLLLLLFESLSWFLTVGDSMPYWKFLGKMLIWGTVWTIIGLGALSLLITVLVFRDLLLVPFAYDLLLILLGLFCGYIIGYAKFHTLLATLRGGWLRYQVNLRVYSVLFFGSLIGVALIWQLPWMALDAIAVLGLLVLYNRQKLLMAMGQVASRVRNV